MDLVMVLTLIPLFALELNSSLTWPFTDISLAIFGSWTKEEPLPVPGGTSPVVTYFRHSKTEGCGCHWRICDKQLSC